MKKRIMVLLCIIMAVSIPVSVYANVSLGIGTGTATFVTARFQMDRVTSAVFNVGFGYWNENGVYVRPQVQFEQQNRNFRIERQLFYPYVGIAVPMILKSNPNIGVSGVLGVSYYVGDGPIEIYLEGLPKIIIVRSGGVGLGFGLGASIGARYSL